MPWRRRGRICYCGIAYRHIYSAILTEIMPRAKFLVSGWECTRCGHKWVPKIVREPKRCPRCKSPYWNKKRVRRVVRMS